MTAAEFWDSPLIVSLMVVAGLALGIGVMAVFIALGRRQGRKRGYTYERFWSLPTKPTKARARLPGWYPDPSHPEVLLWWDGSNWRVP